MRYAHAPSWNELLFDAWKTVNPEKCGRDFEKLKQKIEMELLDRFPDLNEEEQKYHN